MVNEICVADEKNNLLVTYADDITVIALVRNGNASLEVKTGPKKTTWKMVIHGKTSKPKPLPLREIERKEPFKLLGITFQSKPTSWYMHVDNMLSKASS